MKHEIQTLARFNHSLLWKVECCCGWKETVPNDLDGQKSFNRHVVDNKKTTSLN